MASLPPISAETYAESVATSLVSAQPESPKAASSKVAQSSNAGGREREEFEEAFDEASPTRCLFCMKNFDSLQLNLVHMSSEHGLYIPEVDHLASLETFIGYLSTVVNEYNECLQCGMVKQSAEGIRRHMLDKGHCMINLEREPELLEFWEFSDSDDEVPKSKARKTGIPSGVTSQGEFTLASGKTVGTKNKARETRNSARRTALAAKESSDKLIDEDPNEDASEPAPVDPVESIIKAERGSQDRTVALRDSMGLVGVSDQQKRSLVVVQRKMRKQQALVQASVNWARGKDADREKSYGIKINLAGG
jgi:pre-60S factor REI1